MLSKATKEESELNSEAELESQGTNYLGKNKAERYLI